MNAVSLPKSPRRSLVHPLLGRSAALLLVLASGCAQTVTPHDARKPALPTATIEPKLDRVQPEPKGGRKNSSSDQKAPLEPTLTAEPAQQPPLSVSAAAAMRPGAIIAPKDAPGLAGLGLSGSAAAGGGVALGQSVSMGFGSGRGRLAGSHAMMMAPRALMRRDAEMNTESYAHVTENAFLSVADQPLSTFSDRRGHRLVQQRTSLPE